MARPNKDELDYFPFDVDIMADDPFRFFIEDFGSAGMHLWVTLLVAVYGEGYYIKLDDRRLRIFARTLKVDVEKIREMLAAMADYDLLDAELYSNEDILTSRGIQKRYLFATARRKREDDMPYLLIGLDGEEKEDENIIIAGRELMRVNVAETYMSDSYCDINHTETRLSTQSKVKESKVKESSVCKSPVAITEEAHTLRTIDEIFDDTIEDISEGLGIPKQDFTARVRANKSIQAPFTHKLALARWLQDKRAKLYANKTYLKAVANDVFIPDKKQKVKRISSEPVDFDVGHLFCPECGEHVSAAELMVKDSDDGPYRTIHTEEHYGFTYQVARSTEISFVCKRYGCARSNGYSKLEKETT